MNIDCSSQPSWACDDRDEPGSSAEGDVPPERTPRPASQSTDLTVTSSLADEATCSVLQSRIEQILPLLNRPCSRVAVVLIDDADMIALHSKWHGLSTSTDVITFESAPTGPIDVDIAICVDEASRAAADRSHTANDELLLYAVHGLLHCCGFDDHTDSDSEAMHAEEDRLIEAIGLRAVYAPRGGDR